MNEIIERIGIHESGHLAICRLFMVPSRVEFHFNQTWGGTIIKEPSKFDWLITAGGPVAETIFYGASFTRDQLTDEHQDLDALSQLPEDIVLRIANHVAGLLDSERELWQLAIHEIWEDTKFYEQLAEIDPAHSA